MWMDLALCTEMYECHTDLVLQPKSIFYSLSFSVGRSDGSHVNIQCTNIDTNSDTPLMLCFSGCIAGK